MCGDCELLVVLHVEEHRSGNGSFVVSLPLPSLSSTIIVFVINTVIHQNFKDEGDRRDGKTLEKDFPLRGVRK